MTIRRFGRETQRNYIRDVGRFATFLGWSPDTVTAEEVPRFQVEQCERRIPLPTMNGIVSTLRFVVALGGVTGPRRHCDAWSYRQS